jgi:hypothetical protein
MEVLRMGHPTTYSEIMTDSICEQLAEGRSLVRICGAPGYPSRSTVFHWLEEYPFFRDKYARARDLQAERYAAEIIELADTPVESRKVVIKEGSEEITIVDAVERTRLRIDARKWYASKLAPKKYGDKLQTEITGTDGGPVQMQEVREMSDAEIAARLAEIQEKKAGYGS